MRAIVEAVSEDRVGVAFENGCDQQRIIAGIVFQVRVLDEHQLAARVLQSATDAGAFALVLLMQYELDRVRAVAPQQLLEIGFLQELARSVRRAIVTMTSSFCRLSGCSATCCNSFITVLYSL